MSRDLGGVQINFVVLLLHDTFDPSWNRGNFGNIIHTLEVYKQNQQNADLPLPRPACKILAAHTEPVEVCRACVALSKSR